jgi:hypothetical protein
VVADSHHFEEELDHRLRIRTEMDSWIRIRNKWKSWIRIRIKVMRICNPAPKIGAQGGGGEGANFDERPISVGFFQYRVPVFILGTQMKNGMESNATGRGRPTWRWYHPDGWSRRSS